MISLSPCVIPDACALRRDPPRPPELRNATYASQFDWKTVFYDTYRVGGWVVLQGPPLLNLKASVLAQRVFRDFRFDLYERQHAMDIWIRPGRRHGMASIPVDEDFGGGALAINPDGADLFAGRRVILTLSRNNEIRWISDWIRYHHRVHGTEAVLLYDNDSSKYTATELQAELRAAHPGLLIMVVAWPFKYGPQGGGSGAVNGVETPWDSEFCQTGALQHARFRFLRKARSVLNCDIDELVMMEGRRSVHETAERSLLGVAYFGGAWIGNATSSQTPPEMRRHGHFVYLAQEHIHLRCPDKWCAVPRRSLRGMHTWRPHMIVNLPARFASPRTLSYRHFKPISDNWKYVRWEPAAQPLNALTKDERLQGAMQAAGILF